MTREQAKEFIEDATRRLKGHMPALERALLVADRKDAREWLAAQETADEAPRDAQP